MKNNKLDKQYEEYFLDYLENNLSEDKVESFEKALKESPKLARAYEEFCCLFGAVNELKKEEIEELDADFSNKLLTKLESKSSIDSINQIKTSSNGDVKMQYSSKKNKDSKTPAPYMISPSRLGLGLSAVCAVCLVWVGAMSFVGQEVSTTFDSVGHEILPAQSTRPASVPQAAPRAEQTSNVPSSLGDLMMSKSASTKSMSKLKANRKVLSKGKSFSNHAFQGAPVKDGAFFASKRRDRSFVRQPLSIQGESYSSVPENKLTLVKNEPLSTFSIDVDTASYSNLRRMIEQGMLPPANAVRLEEMLNYFSYIYEAPSDKEVPFAVDTELSLAPWNAQRKLLRIALKGYEVDVTSRKPSNLTFLIDTSGSMSQPRKLPLLQSSLGMLLDKLDERDTISIVAYAGSAGVVLEPTPASDKRKIMEAISNMRAGGSTAGAQGIELAYNLALEKQKAGTNSRVILATDGDFNVGVSSEDALVQLIEEKRNKGVFLTILGFGTGNYQDSKMEKLSNHGNGNYFYIDSLLEAKKVLLNDLTGTLFTIAKDVKIQVEFNPAFIKGYRLLGYENRALAAEDFNNDKVDAGELGAGHTVTALYELVPANSEENVLSVDPLKYQKVEKKAESAPAQANGEIVTVKLRYKLPSENKSKLITKAVRSEEQKAFPQTDADFKFQSAIAQFAMLLTNSKYKTDSSFKSALELAKKGKGQDENGYRAEFIRLVEKAELLKKSGGTSSHRVINSNW